MNAQAAEPRALAIARLRRMCKDGTAGRIREAAGLSLSDLSSEVGCAPSCIASWQNGQRAPSRSEAALAYLALLDELAERYLTPA
jgi:transcriptional regulator with XRE-family HTH domain